MFLYFISKKKWLNNDPKFIKWYWERFDILGLTEDERTEVYWAVCELVRNRLEKARSV